MTLRAGRAGDDLALRDVRPCEEPTLFRWHVDALRAHIEPLWGWDEAWQRRDFGKLFATLPAQMVMFEGADIGYIQTQSRVRALHLVNIVIRPAARGKGVGCALIRHLQEQATRRGCAVTLKVFRSNSRAQAFYRRHGFEVTGRTTSHLGMRWANAARAVR